MSKRDIALLQRASLAYLENIDDEGRRLTLGDDDIIQGWNSLDDDADAFRLAVATSLFRGYAHVLHEHLDNLGSSSTANARRAITLSACQVYTPRAYRDKAGWESTNALYS